MSKIFILRRHFKNDDLDEQSCMYQMKLLCYFFEILINAIFGRFAASIHKINILFKYDPKLWRFSLHFFLDKIYQTSISQFFTNFHQKLSPKNLVKIFR